MKKTIVNIMFTSNAVLLLIAIYAFIIKADFIYVRTVFEVFGANIITHLGLLLTKKFESKYVIFEYLLDIVCVLLVICTFAIIFNWYSSIPMWYIIITVFAIYLLGFILDIVRIHKKTKKINELLRKRKIKEDNIVT